MEQRNHANVTSERPSGRIYALLDEDAFFHVRCFSKPHLTAEAPSSNCSPKCVGHLFGARDTALGNHPDLL